MELAPPRPDPVRVGPGEMAVSRDALAVLFTGPIGAGLAVAVYDWEAVAGGLLHALLPNSRLDPTSPPERPGMFIDTGFTALLASLERIGAVRQRLAVYVAGAGELMEGGSDFDIGGQNRAALETAVASCGLKIKANAVGGPWNRGLRMSLAHGEIMLRLFPEPNEFPICPE